MRYWLPAKSVILWLRYLRLRGTAGFEHSQHAVGDEESADHVAGGGHNGDDAENRRECALFLSYKNDGTHDGDGIERVGQRHQRSMQQRRNVADDFESNEGRQHENEKGVEQVGIHRYTPVLGAQLTTNAIRRPAPVQAS